jgi:hypothetical protein
VAADAPVAAPAGAGAGSRVAKRPRVTSTRSDSSDSIRLSSSSDEASALSLRARAAAARRQLERLGGAAVRAAAPRTDELDEIDDDSDTVPPSDSPAAPVPALAEPAESDSPRSPDLLAPPRSAADRVVLRPPRPAMAEDGGLRALLDAAALALPPSTELPAFLA